MPRYFFDVRETGNLAVDDEGIELLDIEAAHQAAARCLLDMARDGISADPFRHNMAIEVRDVVGSLLQAKFTVTLDRPTS